MVLMKNIENSEHQDLSPIAREFKVFVFICDACGQKNGGGIPPTPKVTGSSNVPVISHHEHPLVPPHVMHFMQVPFRTRVKFPHSSQASPSYPLERAC